MNEFADLGLKPADAKENVTMLIATCGDSVLIVLDRSHEKLGWDFASTKVLGEEHRRDAAKRAGLEWFGLSIVKKRIEFVAAHEKRGRTFSAHFVELEQIEFNSIKEQDDGEVCVKKILKTQVGKYIKDRTRRYLASAKITGITF